MFKCTLPLINLILLGDTGIKSVDVASSIFKAIQSFANIQPYSSVKTIKVVVPDSLLDLFKTIISPATGGIFCLLQDKHHICSNSKTNG